MSVLSFAYVWMLTTSQNIFLVVSECSGVFLMLLFFMLQMILPNTRHWNNIMKQLNQKQLSTLHLIFHSLTVI